jgi:hypothetical protein
VCPRSGVKAQHRSDGYAWLAGMRFRTMGIRDEEADPADTDDT